ncbi:adenylate/guanylate cyclase domain-containing protein [uncultured Ruegeria sp.]|uniref:adenylate/guanylate cyclase domain-containing protein n=1 Tax=uncultured Ruegeria sp. TaxID=259304 RepID=UPI00260ABE1B|nr:adenylate/guanylate cyclase domain-containing protein [uncultured Ruegeria sp.]
MTDAKPKRHLAAILAADVEGYSKLMGEDEEGTLAAMTAHHKDLIGPCIAEHRGRLVKTTGDGLLVEFASVVDAVRCAVAIQEGMRPRNAEMPEDKQILFRIGINLGDVIAQDDDVFGDGVNVAARLEALADPGGVCISRAARDQVRDKFDYPLQDLGEVEVKNISRPVWVFKVLLDGSPPAANSRPSRKSLWRVSAAIVIIGLLFGGGLLWWYQAGSTDPSDAILALSDKPSIAVLPFDNLSADAEQEYFSDGVTEDIITDLSKISGLLVIAQNSTFTYKGQAAKVSQIAEDLGVRYVLQGSVRRTDEKIRITTQLIDAATEGHLWAERYDRDITDVFSVQSEVARQVARALSVTLKANENERLYQKYTTNIDAYDVFLQARRTVDVPSRDNILRGEKLFEQVIELDPNFAGGYAGLAFNLSVQVRFQYTDTPSTHLSRALELARKAIELDTDFAWGHIALGGVYVASGDAEAAVDAVYQALILEPNGYEANLFMGFYLQFAGDAASAVDYLLIAKRLSPVETYRDVSFLALAQFMNRNYEEVVRLWTKTSIKPRGQAKIFLAATYSLLDMPEEAAALVEQYLEINPDFNLTEWRYLDTWKSEENRTRLYEAAKAAGVPEFPREN